MKKQMKLFTNMTKPFVLFVLLFAFGVGEMWAGNRRIYFDYSAVTMWPDASAEMKVHCWGGNTGDADYTMSAVAGESNLIYCDIDDGWTNLCFYRKDPNSSSWWTKTFDYNSFGSKNYFKIKNDSEKDGDIDKYKWDSATRWVPGVCIDGLVDVNNPHLQPFTFEENEGTYRVELSAHSTYQFCILEGSTRYTIDNNVWTSDISDYTLNNSTTDYDLRLTTAGAGFYTFEYNKSTHQLSVTYPEVSHPNIDYCYMYGYDNWSHKYLNIWSSSSNIEGTTYPGTEMYNYFTIGDDKYYYFAYGDYAKCQPNDNNDLRKTNEMNTAEGYGQYISYIDGWDWRTFTVRIQLNDLTPTTHVDPTYLEVAFNSDVLTDLTTVPTKTHYDFGGFYTGYDAEKDVAIGTQVIDEGGHWIASVADYTDASKHWIHPGCSTTVYAKWTEHPYEITLTVTPSAPVDGTDSLQGGTIKVNGVEATSVNAHWVTESAEIEAVPANDAYIFKEWRFSKTGEAYDVYVSDEETYSSTSNPIKIKAQHDGTLTAVFQCRYGLIGSLTGSDASGHGMPGWVFNEAEDFKVIAFTSLGEGADKVNLQCPRTLDPNTQYKFRILDRVKDNSVGGSTEGGVLPEQYDPPTYYNNWQLNRMTGSGGQDVLINTKGRGTYTFHITNMSNDGNYWPSIQVDRQPSYQVHFGWKHAEAEDYSSLSTGEEGGWAEVEADEGGVKSTLYNNYWIANGGTITINAKPTSSYDFAGWWSSDAFTGDPTWGSGSPIVQWTVEADANAYAKFTEKSNTFTATSGNNWNTTANWSKERVPTQDEAAIIQSPVEVNVTDAKAKKVLLMQDGGHNGKIDIPAGKELVVRATIKKTTDGSTYGSTEYEDINIGSTLVAGTGALVMDANDGTNKATVNFAVKAKKVDGHNVNQFIGTPFNDENNVLYNYYGTKIYRFMAGHDGNLGPDNEWKRVAETGEKMNGFYGYNILTNQTTEPVLWMQGTLNRSAEETITGYYNGSSNTENMFANSWVAPIYIPNFEDGDFTNIEKTIYIFNAGTPVDQGEHTMGEGTQTTTAAGQYCVVPVKAAEYTGLKVIPSMQAFSVFANGASPSIKFNYTRLVYNPSNGTATIVPTRAPRRTATNDPDAPTVLRLAVTGESGYAAKIVLLERTDFTDNFDDGWDGRFLAGDDAAPQLYAVTPDGNMAINSIPNIEGTLLGFKAGEADNVFTFSFDYDGEAIYLYDTQTQLYTRMLTGNTYTFATTDNAAHNRFILTHKAPSVTTGVEQGNSPSQVTNKMIIDNHLYIFRGGVLYDALGRMIGNGKEARL